MALVATIAGLPGRHEAESRDLHTLSVMTSSPTGSHASLYKSAGAVQSPQPGSAETRSPASTRDLGALPTPPSLSSKDEPGAHKRLSNGSSAADASSVQNDSEAETEILFDDQREEKNTRTTKVKKEQGDDDATMTDDHPSAAITVRDRSGKHSSLEADRRQRRANGDVDKHERTNGRRRRRSASDSPAPTTRSRSSHPPDTIASRGTPSMRASTSPTVEDSERRKSPGTRKRKTREDQPLRASEPPRQKHKSSKSANQPLPSPHTVHAGRPHKRSASTQSNLPNQKRTPRETSTGKYSSRDQESDSDFLSDAQDASGNSPYPPITLSRPRSKRLVNKPLTSPVRAMPQKRKNPLDKYGASELSKACERGNIDEVKQEYEQHPEHLDLADNAGVTPLAKAALNGHEAVVEFLLLKKCKVNCQTKNRETPLMDAVENGHLEVVRILLANGANPHHQNEDGHRALDLVDEDYDDSTAIEKELKKAMRNYAGDDTSEPTASQTSVNAQLSSRKDLFHVDPSRTNLRAYAAKGDAVAVSDILVSIKPDLACITAAARGGHETVLSLLLASAGDDFKRDPDPAKHEETPLLAAIGRGHFGVLKLLLEQDNFNPTRRTKEGKTYYEVAREIRGPKWEKEVELLKEYFDTYRSKHTGKTGKKRATAPGSITVSKKPKAQEISSHRREGSSSPRLAAKPTSPDLKKTKLIDDIPKQRGRYFTKREISQSREQTQRKRRVVDEDSDEESTTEVSRPTSREQPSNKKSLAEDKTKALTSKMRRKSSSSSGKPELLEKKKNAKHSEDKVTVETKDVPTAKQTRAAPNSTAAPPAFEAPPPPPPRETTPEEVREARRLEAQRVAEQLAREAEERRLQAEREAREKRLAALPPTIKRACELGSKRPLYRNGRELGVTDVHLPLHVVTLKADPFDPSASKEDRWCMSFQAVGLLGLREPDLSIRENWQYPTRPVTIDQRSRFRFGYNPQRLAQDFIFPLPGEEGWDEDRGKKEAEASKEAEERFSTMPLVWVRLEDVMQAAKEAGWLQGVEITTWERNLNEKKSDCGSLRAKFLKDAKKCAEVVNGTTPSTAVGDVEMANG